MNTADMLKRMKVMRDEMNKMIGELSQLVERGYSHIDQLPYDILTDSEMREAVAHCTLDKSVLTMTARSFKIKMNAEGYTSMIIQLGHTQRRVWVIRNVDQYAEMSVQRLTQCYHEQKRNIDNVTSFL